MARKVPVGVSALKQDYPIKNGTVVATLIGWKINLENLTRATLPKGHWRSSWRLPPKLPCPAFASSLVLACLEGPRR